MSRLALRTLALPFALTFSVLGIACSAETPNDAPIIDFVESPLVVSAENGTYAIPITIGFHDNNGEVVTHVRYRSAYQSAPSFDAVVEIRTPLPTRESAEVTLVLPASAHTADRRELEITIIDGRGAESTPLPRAITLK
jgi:hypothetical protein